MFVRIWCADGSMSDRPASIEWDGAPAAEWECDVERLVLAVQVFQDDGRPLSQQCPFSMHAAAGACMALRLQLPIITA
jgi:hypothetical protein